jgi:6,7-dimethyl-8-ribityllumazine synthase
MRRYEGTLQAEGLRFGIVVARFNHLVTEPLLEGALAALRRHGAREEDIEVVHVPGSFEAPLFARLLAKSGRIQAVVCLGAIIKGETPHYDYISSAVISSLAAIMREVEVPIALGILTTDTFDQAVQRAGGKLGNKGYEAAVTAIEMASLRRALTS